MASHTVTAAELDELVELMDEAASAYIGGDMRRYFALVKPTDDFTLMGPFGGNISRETTPSDERIAELEDYFERGEATLEVLATYSSGDLAVLVVVERQRGVVGHTPEQDWSFAGHPGVPPRRFGLETGASPRRRARTPHNV